MSNPILDKIDEFGEAVASMRKAHDESLAEIKKGNETRGKELEIQSDRANKKVDEALKAISAIQRDNEAYKTRVEIIEALNERPKGTAAEQLEQKHTQAWLKFVRSGMKDAAIEAEVKSYEKQLLETKADSVLVGTALQGGNGVPKVISTAIETLILRQSEIVANVNNVAAGSSDYNELVTIRGANGGWSSETGSRSQTNAPNLRKVTPTHGELYAFPRASNWSLQDVFFDVVSWLQQDAAETMAVSLATAIFNGNGSSKPTGMTNSAPTSADDYASPMRAAAVFEYLATGTSPVTTFRGDMLIDLQALLRPGYQQNAKWAMNTTTQAAVRKMKDTTNQYIWQPSFQVGQPQLLLGKPIFSWEDLGSVTSANALPVAYGDFQRGYTLVKIGGMTLIRDEVTVPGFTNYLMAQRYGGIPRNNDAVKFLKMAAS
jgi:HK97 family phage major capsid protein